MKRSIAEAVEVPVRRVQNKSTERTIERKADDYLDDHIQEEKINHAMEQDALRVWRAWCIEVHESTIVNPTKMIRFIDEVVLEHERLRTSNIQKQIRISRKTGNVEYIPKLVPVSGADFLIRPLMHLWDRQRREEKGRRAQEREYSSSLNVNSKEREHGPLWDRQRPRVKERKEWRDRKEKRVDGKEYFSKVKGRDQWLKPTNGRKLNPLKRRSISSEWIETEDDEIVRAGKRNRVNGTSKSIPFPLAEDTTSSMLETLENLERGNVSATAIEAGGWISSSSSSSSSTPPPNSSSSQSPLETFFFLGIPPPTTTPKFDQNPVRANETRSPSATSPLSSPSSLIRKYRNIFDERGIVKRTPRPERVNGGNTVPKYELPRVKTVHEMYTLWSIGLNGTPAVYKLNEQYGLQWRDPNDRNFYSAVSGIITEIGRLTREMRIPVEEAVDLLDAVRNGNGGTIRRLRAYIMRENKARKEALKAL
ncbi:hypothetical protein BGZ51_005271 [Haplosporangium sp. Z 767]|nr:hypothetical protein BGZ51_005271 [Haplosporangium sp. Z 767]KAF9189320.1 hypothetical protein BGZ50_000843 [Haplosporangium sp. Z 11]